MGFKVFSGVVDSLEPIRLFVKEDATKTGLDKKSVYNLMLAVDEIATNIVLYGYEGAGKVGNIDVKTEIVNNQLIVTFEDDAIPFDPTKKELPDEEDFLKPLEDRQIGGLGIYLTINGVDEFKYEYVNNRNRNTFIMNLKS